MKLLLRLLSCSLAVLVLGCCTHHHRPETDAARRPLTGTAETSQQGLAQSLADAEKALADGLQEPAVRARYNAAVLRATQAWMSISSDSSRASAIACQSGDRAYTLKASWPSRVKFDELIPASTIKSRELKRRVTRDGVGVPFVAWWKHNEERAKQELFMNVGGYVSPVTATLSLGDAAGGKRTALLVLNDPRVKDTSVIAGKTQTLAEDITSVGEFVLSLKEVRMSGLGALLRSSNHLDKLGLISLEPPAPDRVPVILVHGLMSKPATWQNVINELWSDPLLQKSCQFYFFRYPTGVPVIYSAAKLRERLGVLHDKLKRSGDRTNYSHMVLIGHSMGGLVSKSQVQDSGDRLWVNVFGATPDKLNLSKDEIKALRSYLEYKPNPYVSRVIFVATPHRGSSLASGTLGSIGSRLVNLPNHIMGDAFNVLQGQAPERGPIADLLKQGVPTSIDNLSPKSKFVQTSINLPLRPGLHAHSIIGNKKQKPLNDPSCSDGFVPYTSAHLDGVESEKIVPYGHSAHEHPMAVEEIRRILHEHVRGR